MTGRDLAAGQLDWRQIEILRALIEGVDVRHTPNGWFAVSEVLPDSKIEDGLIEASIVSGIVCVQGDRVEITETGHQLWRLETDRIRLWANALIRRELAHDSTDDLDAGGDDHSDAEAT